MPNMSRAEIEPLHEILTAYHAGLIHMDRYQAEALDAAIAALEAEQEPIGYVLERERDPMFPKFRFSKEAAIAWQAGCNVGPPITIRPAFADAPLTHATDVRFEGPDEIKYSDPTGLEVHAVWVDDDRYDLSGSYMPGSSKSQPDTTWVLKRIIDDLPANRDWLDPTIERAARDAIAAPATGEAG